MNTETEDRFNELADFERRNDPTKINGYFQMGAGFMIAGSIAYAVMGSIYSVIGGEVPFYVHYIILVAAIFAGVLIWLGSSKSSKYEKLINAETEQYISELVAENPLDFVPQMISVNEGFDKQFDGHLIAQVESICHQTEVLNESLSLYYARNCIEFEYGFVVVRKRTFRTKDYTESVNTDLSNLGSTKLNTYTTIEDIRIGLGLDQNSKALYSKAKIPHIVSV